MDPRDPGQPGYAEYRERLVRNSYRRTIPIRNLAQGHEFSSGRRPITRSLTAAGVDLQSNRTINFPPSPSVELTSSRVSEAGAIHDLFYSSPIGSSLENVAPPALSPPILERAESVHSARAPIGSSLENVAPPALSPPILERAESVHSARAPRQNSPAPSHIASVGSRHLNGWSPVLSDHASMHGQYGSQHYPDPFMRSSFDNQYRSHYQSTPLFNHNGRDHQMRDAFPHAVPQLPRANIGSVSIPCFNGSAETWHLFTTSLRSYFISAGVNLNLLSSHPSAVTAQENLFLWSTLEQALRGTALGRFSSKFMDNGIAFYHFLVSRFESSGLKRLMELRREFETLCFNGDPSLFFLELESICVRLSALGQNTADAVLTARFIEGLPHDMYNQIIAVIYSMDDITSQQAHSMVTKFHMRLSEKPHLFHTEHKTSSSLKSDRSKSGGKLAYNTKGTLSTKDSAKVSPKVEYSNYRGKPGLSASLSDVVCSKCKFKGHSASNCRVDITKYCDKHKRHGHTTAECKMTNHTANVALALSCDLDSDLPSADIQDLDFTNPEPMLCSEEECASSASNSNSMSYLNRTGRMIVDSGASGHYIDPTLNITSTNVRIADCKPGSINISVAGGQIVQSSGTCNATIKVNTDSGQSADLVLRNAHLVSGLSTNLISLSRVMQCGGRFDLSLDRPVLMHNDHVMPLQIDNNMVTIQTLPSDGTIFATAMITNPAMHWHRMLGHVNFRYLKSLRDDPESPIKFSDADIVPCETCLLNKGKHKSHKDYVVTRALIKGQRFHLDSTGKIFTPAVGGWCYIMCFTDDFSRYRFVYPMRHKHEALAVLHRFINQIKTKGITINFLRTDNAGEFISDEARALFISEGIELELSAPHSQQQNGVAERSFGILTNIISCMMSESRLPDHLWVYAYLHAVYVLNRTPTLANKMATPYFIWHDKRPNYSALHNFGCKAFVLIEKSRREGKFKPNSWEGIFLGSSPDHADDTYYIFNPATNRVDVSRHVTFIEESTPVSLNPEINSNTLNDLTGIPAPKFQPHHMVTRSRVNEQIVPVPDQLEEDHAFLSSDQYLQSIEQLEDDDTPKHFHAALAEDKRTGTHHWRDAISKENASLEKNHVGDLVPLPSGKRLLDTRYHFKIKRDATGKIIKYKARYVVKGFLQCPGSDYDLTYAPTASITSTRLLIALAAYNRWKIYTIDVETAFLQGKIPEDQELYIKPPSNPLDPFKPKSTLAYKLNKSLYGLKQASRVWNETFHEALTMIGFNYSGADLCVYTGTIDSDYVMMVIHVDDVIITGTTESAIHTAIAKIREHFDISEATELDLFLGMVVKTDSTGIIHIDQNHYVNQLLAKYKLDSAHSQDTPAVCGGALEESIVNGNSSILLDAQGITFYQSIVGSLLYISSKTRPDIAHTVMQLCRRMSKPTEALLVAAKRVLRYLKGNPLSLSYFPRSSTDPSVPILTGYADANWAGDLDTRRSTGAYLFFLAGGPITWSSKLHPIITNSSTESEYVTLSNAAREAMAIRSQLADFQAIQNVPTVIFEDNTGAISLAENHINHQRTKHIDIRYHYVRECIYNKSIAVHYIATKYQVADILTKTLPKTTHWFLLSKIFPHASNNNKSTAEDSCSASNVEDFLVEDSIINSLTNSHHGCRGA